MFSVILAEPSNDVPDIVLAVASAVAVSALPVTAPVKLPTNPWAASALLNENLLLEILTNLIENKINN